MQRRLCFLVVGGLGAIVNLACFSGAYYSHLRITGTSAAYGMAFPAGTECSIFFNFSLYQVFTYSQGAVQAVSSSASLRGPNRPYRAHAQKGCFYVIAR